jgi:hypothetical protein
MERQWIDNGLGDLVNWEIQVAVSNAPPFDLPVLHRFTEMGGLAFARDSCFCIFFFRGVRLLLLIIGSFLVMRRFCIIPRLPP